MDKLLGLLATGEKRINLAGLQGSSKTVITALLAEKTQRPLLYITPSERLAERAVQDISLFAGLPVIHYPGFDIPPYTPLSPDQATVAERLHTLYRLHTDNSPLVLVASCESLLRRVIPRSILGSLAELVITGEEVDQDRLIRHLTDLGYEHLSLVQSIGDFSVRGGIVDIFPPGYEAPVRLDFFGDTIESLRTFNPISQRSIQEIDEAIILPASNILFPRVESADFVALQYRFQKETKRLNWSVDAVDALLDKISSGRRFPGIEFFLPLFYDAEQGCPCPLNYLAENTIVVFSDAVEINRSIELAWERIEANYTASVSSNTPALAPDTVFVSPGLFAEKTDRFTQVKILDFLEEKKSTAGNIEFSSQNHLLLKQEIDLQRKQQGILLPLTSLLKEWLSRDESVVMACRSPRHALHLAELLSHYDIPTQTSTIPLEPDSFIHPKGSSEVLLLDQPLSAGFDLRLHPDVLIHVLSESELFGERRLGPRKKTRPAGEEIIRFDELNQDDIVVHREHGLGAYQRFYRDTLPGS